MTDALIQLGMALFGLTAIWWAMGNSPRLRRWAPVVGLSGQVFWFTFAWLAHRKGMDVRGLVVLCVAYTAAYGRGIFVQWGAPEGKPPIDMDTVWHGVRRGIWRWTIKGYGPGFTVAGRCIDCGIPLSYHECTYYGTTCERCEGITFHATERTDGVTGAPAPSCIHCHDSGCSACGREHNSGDGVTGADQSQPQPPRSNP